MPEISKDEFSTLVKQTGLTLTDAQVATLFSVYPTLQSLIARATAAMPREAEPSLTFTAEIR